MFAALWAQVGGDEAVDAEPPVPVAAVAAGADAVELQLPPPQGARGRGAGPALRAGRARGRAGGGRGGRGGRFLAEHRLRRATELSTDAVVAMADSLTNTVSDEISRPFMHGRGGDADVSRSSFGVERLWTGPGDSIVVDKRRCRDRYRQRGLVVHQTLTRERVGQVGLVVPSCRGASSVVGDLCGFVSRALGCREVYTTCGPEGPSDPM